MESKLEKILLYETYKNMLTLNMQDVFEQYYYSDLSLREIGENNGISFQAVRDSLKKTEKTYNLEMNQIRQIEEWTKLKCGEILFDSTKDNWSYSSSTFDSKIFFIKSLEHMPFSI